jgi:hypothetical protein
MTIRIVPEGNKQRYGAEHYDALQHHYNERIFQVHVMNEYARYGMAKIREALDLVVAYFTMDKEAFIQRFFNKGATCWTGPPRPNHTARSWNHLPTGIRSASSPNHPPRTCSSWQAPAPAKRARSCIDAPTSCASSACNHMPSLSAASTTRPLSSCAAVLQH